MKILHINQSDISGGAAIAAHRLHLGLKAQGATSKMLVARAVAPSVDIVEAPEMTLADRAALHLTKGFSPNHINILRGRKIRKHPLVQDADVINLNNLHTGLFFNYLCLPTLGRAKPLVWTLHDMWAFTGHCSYSYDCSRWETGCGKCPYPETYPALSWDYSRWEWKWKRASYRRTEMTIVTPSKWLGEQVTRSMLNDRPLEVIPYAIDTEVYRPGDDVREVRRKMGIRDDAFVVMFICDDLRDKRKGGDLLEKLINSLPEKIQKKLVLLAVGNGGAEMRNAFRCECIVTGYIVDETRKSELYSCADVFICASRADNLPLVLQESLACGTPLVAFDVGGVSDVVRHGITGFLSPSEDFQGAGKDLVLLIEDEARRREMRENCRKIALAEYRSEVITRRYLAVYESVLESAAPSEAAAPLIDAEPAHKA